jgi:hypothetical protein
MAGGAKALWETTLGSRERYSGMGGGPFGFPMDTDPRARFAEGFFFVIGLPDAVASNP